LHGRKDLRIAIKKLGDVSAAHNTKSADDCRAPNIQRKQQASKIAPLVSVQIPGTTIA
jgi:hypothetical protein